MASDEPAFSFHPDYKKMPWAASRVTELENVLEIIYQNTKPFDYWDADQLEDKLLLIRDLAHHALRKEGDP